MVLPGVDGDWALLLDSAQERWGDIETPVMLAPHSLVLLARR